MQPVPQRAPAFPPDYKFRTPPPLKRPAPCSARFPFPLASNRSGGCAHQAGITPPFARDGLPARRGAFLPGLSAPFPASGTPGASPYPFRLFGRFRKFSGRRPPAHSPFCRKTSRPSPPFFARTVPSPAVFREFFCLFRQKSWFSAFSKFFCCKILPAVLYCFQLENSIFLLIFLSSSGVEHPAVNRSVVGSIPTWGAIGRHAAQRSQFVRGCDFFCKGLRFLC